MMSILVRERAFLAPPQPKPVCTLATNNLLPHPEGSEKNLTRSCRLTPAYYLRTSPLFLFNYQRSPVLHIRSDEVYFIGTFMGCSTDSLLAQRVVWKRSSPNLPSFTHCVRRVSHCGRYSSRTVYYSYNRDYISPFRVAISITGSRCNVGLFPNRTGLNVSVMTEEDSGDKSPYSVGRKQSC